MKKDPISLWFSDDCAWIKPSGAACEVDTRRVKDFAREAVQHGTYEFVVDLSECTAMDETFMGTLVGIALRARELGKGRVRLANPTVELDAQIRRYGLDVLFDMEP